MFPRFTSLCVLCPECFRLCEQGKWLLERLPKRLSRATRERSLRHESKAGGGVGSEGTTGPSRRGLLAGRFLFLKSSFNVLNLCVQIGAVSSSPRLQRGVLNELSSSAA